MTFFKFNDASDSIINLENVLMISKYELVESYKYIQEEDSVIKCCPVCKYEIVVTLNTRDDMCMEYQTLEAREEDYNKLLTYICMCNLKEE